MRNASNITVLRHIVHLTDRKNDLLQLARQETVLDDEMKTYFVGHIDTSLKKSATRAATFCNPDNPDTGGLCRGIIAGEIDFIEGSHKLVHRLFDKMDRRNTSGSFAVILFEAIVSSPQSNELEKCTLLALLKMDAGSRYVTSFDEANSSTQLRKQENTLPSESDGLQKCAFIWRKDKTPEDTQHYDLMLLDAQNSGDQDVARFFQEDFLDAEFAFSSRRQTMKFVDTLLAATDQVALIEGWDEEKKLEMRDAIYSATERPYLDIPVWVQELPLEETERQALDSQIQTQGSLQDLAFQPNQVRRPNRVVYRGDNGLEVKIPKEFVSRIMQSEEPKLDPDGSTYYEITLRTRDWRTKK